MDCALRPWRKAVAFGISLILSLPAACAPVADCVISPPLAATAFAEKPPGGWTFEGNWTFTPAGAVGVSDAGAVLNQPVALNRIVEARIELPAAGAKVPAKARFVLRIGDRAGDGPKTARVQCEVFRSKNRWQAVLSVGDKRAEPIRIERSGLAPKAKDSDKPAPTQPVAVSIALAIGGGRVRMLIDGTQKAVIEARAPAKRFVTIRSERLPVVSFALLKGLPPGQATVTGAAVAARHGALSWQQGAVGGPSSAKSVLLTCHGVPMLARAGPKGVATLDLAAEKNIPRRWDMDGGSLTETVPARSYAWAYLLFRVDGADAGQASAMGFGLRTRHLGDLKNIYVGGRGRVSDEGVAVRPVPTLGPRWYLAKVPLNPAAMHWLGHVDKKKGRKPLELHLGRPFQNSTHVRHAGDTSALRVAAITLVESAVELTVQGNGLGNVYCQPERPALQAVVANRTARPLDVTLTTELIAHGLPPRMRRQAVSLAPGSRRRLDALAAPITRRGHYRVRVVADAGELGTSQWRTNVALLAADARRNPRSIFGCWPKLWGDRATDVQRQYLFEKAGVGYRHKTHNYTHRLFGTRGHLRVTDAKSAEQIVRKITESRPQCRVVFFGWEKRWRMDQTYGIPSVITAGRPESLPKEVNEKIDGAVKELKLLSAALRRLKPKVKISLGNTGVNWVTPLLQRGIRPGEHFDYFGTEEGLFNEPPERPCDAVGNINWWARAICEHFGHYDVPLFHSESMYYSTGPAFARLAERDQAAWYVRSYLIGMAYDSVYGISGAMVDSSNQYRYSIWGTAGYCNQAPECSPKLSLVTYATLTQLLDGTAYAGKLDTGTTSVYALHFKQPDGTDLYALWNLRGRREVAITRAGKGVAKAVDAMNRPVEPRQDGEKLSLVLSDLPLYVRGVTIRGIEPGRNVPPGSGGSWKRIASLPKVGDWSIDRRSDLKFGAPRKWRGVPRVRGNFTVRAAAGLSASGPDAHDAVRVAQRRHVASGIIPRYVKLRWKPDAAIALPAGTTKLGIRVYGNSTWAEVKFLLRRPGGREIIILEDDLNGVMADNFDGWRLLSTPYLARLGVNTADGGYKLVGLVVTMPEQQVYVDELVTTVQPWVALSGVYVSERKDAPISYLPW